jgi:hypothetical protein
VSVSHGARSALRERPGSGLVTDRRGLAFCVKRVKPTEFDWIDDIAELERWEESDRKTWRRIASLFDDWMVSVEESSRVVSRPRSDETSLSEDVRPGESDRPVLDALVRLSTRLDTPSR